MTDDSRLESAKPIVKESFNSLSDQRAEIPTDIANDLAVIDGHVLLFEQDFGHYIRTAPERTKIDTATAQTFIDQGKHIPTLPFKYSEDAETLATHVAGYLLAETQENGSVTIASDLKSAIRELATGETGGISAKKAFEKIQPAQETAQPSVSHNGPQQDLV